MKELNMDEIQLVSGGKIKPYRWIGAGGFGAWSGALCATITAFSANPITFPVGIITGMILGVGLSATHDILKEYES